MLCLIFTAILNRNLYLTAICSHRHTQLPRLKSLCFFVLSYQNCIFHSIYGSFQIIRQFFPHNRDPFIIIVVQTQPLD